MSSLNKLDILRLFKENLVKFVDSMIEQFPDEKDLIIVRIMFENHIPIDDVMQRFVTRIIPNRQHIMDKDDKFFTESNDIFEGIKNEKILHFKTLWLSKKLTTDDRGQIWKWFMLFLRLSESYVEICGITISTTTTKVSSTTTMSTAN